MRYKGPHTIAILLVASCIVSTQVLACEVAIQVSNRSATTIVTIEYRKTSSDSWSGNLISRQIGPNGDSQVVRWDGVGDYDIAIGFTNTSTPTIVETDDICARSELVATTEKVIIR